MDLPAYLKSVRGRAAALAASLGVTPVMVSQWATGTKLVPAERCPSIERATEGLVRCEELRPDIEWAVVRNGSGVPEGEARSAPAHKDQAGMHHPAAGTEKDASHSSPSKEAA